MTKRSYRTMNSVWDKIVSLEPDYAILPLSEVYKAKMNQDYYAICYYNLYEKWLCGGISSEDWAKIKEPYKMLLDYEEEENEDDE